MAQEWQSRDLACIALEGIAHGDSVVRRHAARRDLAEPAIVQALEAVGAKVYRDLPVDLLVYFRGAFHCLEVKTPKMNPMKKQRVRQGEFIKDTGTPIVKTPQAAIEAITHGARYAST